MDTTALETAKTAEAGPHTRIRSVGMADRALVVAWGDGHESRFHFIWLRHNCRCERCFGPGTGSNLVFVPDIPETIRPLTAAVNGAGNLAVVWNQDGHASVYDAAWLRAHCYSEPERRRRRHVPSTWAREKSDDLPIHPYAAFFEDEGKLRALESLRDLGFALLRGGPTVPDRIETVAREIGPLRETSFGRILEIKTNPTLKLLAYAPDALPLHMDDVYRWCILNINVFHCVQADATGGGVSVLIDGFKIAEVLRRENPAAFDILARTPILFRRHYENEDDFRAYARVIVLDGEGAVAGIRFSDKPFSALDVPEEAVEPFYAAYRAFAAMTRDPRFELRFAMQSGDFLLFDNHRLLHGRTAVAGPRHLQTCFIDREDFHSRLRILGRRLGRDDWDMVLGGGVTG